MNQSVHAVDLLQWIAGPVKMVSAYAGSRIHAEIEVEDTLACSLQFENGAYGVIMGTTGMWPGIAVRSGDRWTNGTAVSEDGLKVYKFRDERPEDRQLVEQLTDKLAQSTGGGASPYRRAGGPALQNIQASLRLGRKPRRRDRRPRSRVKRSRSFWRCTIRRRGGAPIEVR